MKNFHRSLWFTACLLALAAPALANEQLAGEMKQMSADLRQIQAQLADATQNASTITALDDFADAVTKSQALVPDSVAKLPADQQPGQLKAFQDLLGKLKEQVLVLRADLIKGDNAAAVALLPTLSSIKAQGHHAFNN